MSQANSQSEFSTIYALRLFLKTLKTAHDVLEKYPQANKELAEIISGQEYSLRKQIQIAEQNLSQKAPHIDRDTSYTHSMWYQWDLFLDRFKKK